MKNDNNVGTEKLTNKQKSNKWYKEIGYRIRELQYTNTTTTTFISWYMNDW